MKYGEWCVQTSLLPKRRVFTFYLCSYPFQELKPWGGRDPAFGHAALSAQHTEQQNKTEGTQAWVIWQWATPPDRATFLPLDCNVRRKETSILFNPLLLTADSTTVKFVEKNAITSRDGITINSLSPTSAEFHFHLILVRSLANFPKQRLQTLMFIRPLSKPSQPIILSLMALHRLRPPSRVSHHVPPTPAIFSPYPSM